MPSIGTNYSTDQIPTDLDNAECTLGISRFTPASLSIGSKKLEISFRALF